MAFAMPGQKGNGTAVPLAADDIAGGRPVGGVDAVPLDVFEPGQLVQAAAADNGKIDPGFLASGIDGWFEKNVLGASTGYDSASGLNTYNINYANFYKGMTPAEYQATRYDVAGKSNTWVNNGRVTLSNDSLFHLPGGDAGFAWLIDLDVRGCETCRFQLASQITGQYRNLALAFLGRNLDGGLEHLHRFRHGLGRGFSLARQAGRSQ